MAEKQNTPEIRFEGFTDPWEQRKFSDFVVASGTKNRDNLPLQSFSVSNDRGFVPQDEQFENGGTVRDADKSMYWIVEPGSFAYNPARINVGSIGYLSTSENVIVSSLYEVFRTDESCDDRFLWHWFKSPLFMKQIEMLQEGGVRLYFFFDKLLLSEIWMPSVEEQRLIGGHFDRLDDLITLHQRKYDKLCTVKKSMLDKMFPKPGETEPEIRFEGFTDPWEQRKLGEVASEFQSGEFISATEITENGDYPVYGGNGLRGYANRYNHEGFYALIGRQGALCGNVNCADGKAYFTEHAVAVQANQCNDTGFLVYLLSRMNLGQYSGQSAQPGLAVSTLKEVETLLPSKYEQYRIGSLLKDLDSLITLHQRKLELLRNIKKSLLDRMFV